MLMKVGSYSQQPELRPPGKAFAEPCRSNHETPVKVVASTWQAHLKRAGEVVARYGGEEFVSLLPFTDIHDAKKIAEQIRIAIETANPKFGEIRIKLNISLGVSCLSLSGQDDMAALLQRADSALYDAKTQGRNRVAVKEYEGDKKV